MASGLRIRLNDTGDTLQAHVICGGSPDLNEQTLWQMLAYALAPWPDRLPVAAVLHCGRFDGRSMGPGWMWDDGDGPWAARVSAATINGNSVLHRLQTTTRGYPLPVLIGAGSDRVRRDSGIRRPRRDWRDRRDTFRVPPWADETPRSCSVEYPDSLFARLLREGILR
ncbi:MAG: hypothetical protein KDC10_17235, partial [Calditrichaeota bacterium]|nr:hypothetical protein [Calditrichota bacterium]